MPENLVRRQAVLAAIQLVAESRRKQAPEASHNEAWREHTNVHSGSARRARRITCASKRGETHWNQKRRE